MKERITEALVGMVLAGIICAIVGFVLMGCSGDVVYTPEELDGGTVEADGGADSGIDLGPADAARCQLVAPEELGIVGCERPRREVLACSGDTQPAYPCTSVDVVGGWTVLCCTVCTSPDAGCTNDYPKCVGYDCA